MIKTIYATTAKPGISREAFVHHWRAHGALAMRQRGFWDPVVRYLQSDRLRDVSGFPGADPAYVAVGEIHYRDTDGRDASNRAPELAEVLTPDGLQILDRRYSLSLGIEEIFMLKGCYAPVKLYHFITAPNGADRAAFLDALQSDQKRLLSEKFASGVRRAVLGRALQTDSPADATLEFSFDVPSEAVRFHTEWMTRIAEQPDTSLRFRKHIIIPAFVSLFYDRRFYQ